MTPEQAAYMRNQRLKRQDIEWAVGPSGLYLRDKPSWTAERTRQLDAQAEADRTRWKAATNGT